MNPGGLKRRGDELYWWSQNYSTPWCPIHESGKFHQANYRGIDYWATFTMQQYVALPFLVRWLQKIQGIPDIYLLKTGGAAWTGDTSLAPVTLNVKRFTCNTAIAKQSKLTDVLYKKLFAAYRGFHTYSKDGKIQLRVERPTKSSPMVSAIAAGATSLTTNLPYFAVGDSILLSPFTAQAEFRQVVTATAGTITFAAATYAHAAGAAVYQIAMAFDDANMIGTAAYPLQDRQGSVNRVVVKHTNPAAAFPSRSFHVNDYEHQAQIHRANSGGGGRQRDR